MANKFEKKEWTDRQSQYPSRRRLTPTNIENTYDVERAEGDVTEPGNAFDAQNMNDMENRIFGAFSSLDGTDISILDKNNVFSKSNLEDVLFELFTYASNGKKLVANAIGGSASPSDSFSVIARKIKNGKINIANAVGETKSGRLNGTESLEAIANYILANKCSFSSDGNQYIVGENFPGNNVLWERRINYNFGFTPNRIATFGPSINTGVGVTYSANFGGGSTDYSSDLDTGRYQIGVKDLSSDGFTIWYKSGNSSTNMSLESGIIYFTAYRIPI